MMASSFCPWPFLSPPKTATPEVMGKTFSQALAESDVTMVTQLPPKTIIGDKVKIKITQKYYEVELGIGKLIFMER